MKVLVTGASGFIGSHVTRALSSRGIEVMAFDHHQSAVPKPGISQFLGDVRDPVAVSEAVAISDGVIHLAGVLGTAETIDDPRPSVETNIMGSLNVFAACRRYGKRAVYITVGNWHMLNSYAVTKTAAEHLAWMANNEWGTQIAVVRALNAYGPGQKEKPVRKIIPNMILPALRGDPITIYGDGEQVMDMIWVGDVADILVRALLENHGQYKHRPEMYQPNPIKFEAGTGRRTTVNEIAQLVVSVVGGAGVEHVKMRPGEPEHAVVIGDPLTLKPLYGGRVPTLKSLEQGILETVAWYRERENALVPDRARR